MGIFSRPKTALAKQPTILHGVKVQASSYGDVVPIVFGQNRVSGKLLDYQDFTPIASTSVTNTGGKGLGGGQHQQKTTSYTYKAAVVILLAQGPIQGLYNVWDTKGKFAQQNVTENYTVPSGGGTYTVGHSSNYYDDFGVGRLDSYSVNANDYGDIPRTYSGSYNSRMQRVFSAPTGAGQYYNPSPGQYQFHAADVGKQMSITYTYTVPDSSSNGQATQILSLTLFTGQPGQSPWSYMTTNHPGHDLGYSNLAYLASSSMDLGSSGSLPNYTYEVIGRNPFGAGITDANPSDVLNALLTDPLIGCGYPAGALGSLAQYSNYCIANGLFISPVLNSQTQLNTVIQDILDATNSNCYFSEGLLKIVPYGDTTVVGNGVTYTPATQPLYDFTDDDFIASGKGQDPILITRDPWQDAYNDVQIEWSNRANSYNTEIMQEKDDGSIAQFGHRPKGSVQYDFITTAAVATFTANTQLKREVYIRKSYQFTVGWRYCLIEPMDLVTLTDSRLGLSKTPCRITEVNEDEKGNIKITAEEFPWGTATATLYAKQGPLGTFLNPADADPGNVSTPMIFAATNRMTGGPQNGYEVWMAVSGASSSWGGCFVYASADGATYKQVGIINGSARMGVLTASLPSHADPDTSDTLSIDLTESFGVLSSGAQADADNLRTACVILDSSGSFEVITYETLTLTSSYHYTSNAYLRRGLLGTAPAAHSSGAQFARLDDAIFVYDFDPSEISQTLHFKFVSFNTVGARVQSLASVSAYTLTIPGTGGAAGLTAAADALGVRISWDELIGSSVAIVSYNVYRNTTNNAATATKIASVPSNGVGVQTYYDKSASVDTLYYYWVTGVTAGSGIETAKAGPVSDAGLGPGTHSSYRPTTNPLTAVDAGSSATINVAAFTMQIGGLQVNYGSGSITSLSYNTIYYIFLNDPGFTGGSVTYQATTLRSNAINSYGQLFVGSIKAPQSGGAQAVGNNDGGAGAQVGGTFSMSPTLVMDSSLSNLGSGTLAGIGFDQLVAARGFSKACCDGDSSTGVALPIGSLSPGESQAVTLLGWPSFSYNWQSLILKVKYSVTSTSSADANDQAQIKYSLNGWSSFTSMLSVSGPNLNQSGILTAAIPVTTGLSSLSCGMQVVTSASHGIGQLTLTIYEVWVEGQL